MKCRAKPELSQGRVSFVELGHFEKRFVTQKEKRFEVFSSRYS